MCGICGFFNTNPYTPPSRDEVMTLLTNIEARGADATGFAYAEDQCVGFWKEPIRASLVAKLKDLDLHEDVPAWVGHTRAATQGSPNDNRNNHPFVADGFALVHNGLVGNYHELSRQYRHALQGDCDSEVILHGILDRWYQGETVKDAISKMAFATDALMACALVSQEGELWLWRRGEPLCVALSPESTEIRFASTYYMLRSALPKANEWYITSLEDNTGVHFYQRDGRLRSEMFYVPDSPEKGKHSYYYYYTGGGLAAGGGWGNPWDDDGDWRYDRGVYLPATKKEPEESEDQEPEEKDGLSSCVVVDRRGRAKWLDSGRRFRGDYWSSLFECLDCGDTLVRSELKRHVRQHSHDVYNVVGVDNAA